MRAAPLLLAFVLLTGCTPHKSHSAWTTCESHLSKSYGAKPGTNLEIDVASRKGSGDTVTFVCDVTVQRADRRSDPMAWYFWLFGAVEFEEEYRHTVTLKRTRDKWRVTSSEGRRVD